MYSFTDIAQKFSQLDMIHQPGPQDPCFFYPNEFYVFDNFSSFQIEYKGVLYPTSEHAYQAVKFIDTNPEVHEEIKLSRSPYDAQKIANDYKNIRNPNRNDYKRGIMKEILYCKIDQHPYIKKKLLESGNRIIIEDSWSDAEWGRGPNKNGQNLLGEIWMEIRSEII